MIFKLFLQTYVLPTNASQNITGMSTLFHYVNTDLSGGLLALMLMLGIFVVIFIALKDYRAANAFLVASFFNVIISIFFRVLGEINNKWMYLSIILVGFGLVWVHIDNKKSGM
jgi:hypothetical protein